MAEDLKITNKIQVKRGTGKPGPEVLDEGELGYDTEGKVLYIGNKEGDHSQVGNGFINISQLNNTLTFSKADGTSTSATISLSDLGVTTSLTDINNLMTNLSSKVPTSRTVNDKPLSSDISLTYSDVGAAASGHNHSASNITSGVLSVARGGTGRASFTKNSILLGGSSGTSIVTKATKNGALYATTANGELQIGTLPIAQGGTGATDGATGLANLLAEGSTILSSHQYGDELPETPTAGRIFFKKVPN